MRVPLPSRSRPFRLFVGVRASEPLDLHVRISDAHMPNTYYINRRVPFDQRLYDRSPDGYRMLELPMPIAPDEGWLEILDLETGGDQRFQVESIQAVPLGPTQVWGFSNELDFADFAIDFAERAGYLQPGYYNSPDQQFLIHYLPVIRNEHGIEQLTPARISRQTGRIQVSQKHLLRYTVYMRIMILFHEWFHWVLNTRSEIEADCGGIRMYLDLGFPATEALYALTKIFTENPASQQSRDRVDALVNRMVRFYLHWRDRHGQADAAAWDQIRRTA